MTSESYRVIWEINIVATSPRDAAKQARDHQTRLNTTAVVFDVFDEHGNKTHIDLLED